MEERIKEVAGWDAHVTLLPLLRMLGLCSFSVFHYNVGFIKFIGEAGRLNKVIIDGHYV